jgi:hypothetical protein
MGGTAQSCDPVPHWERRFVGRFQWEMDAFAKANVKPSIDNNALAEGRLELSLNGR